MANEVERLRARKDGAYDERMHLVAALARMFPSGIRDTTSPGWTPSWKGCVYIDLPTGQIAYHYHTRHADLFRGLPPYSQPWDGHGKDEAHARLRALWDPPAPVPAAPHAAQAEARYSVPMTPDQAQKIEQLHAFAIGYARAGKTRRQFWQEFDALAGDLGNLAFADDASPELLEQYCEVLANADDAGFAGPEDELDNVMD